MNRLTPWAHVPGTVVTRLSMIDLAVLIDATSAFVRGDFYGLRGSADVEDARRLLDQLKRIYEIGAREAYGPASENG